MKKRNILLPLSLFAVFALSGCGAAGSTNAPSSNTHISTPSQGASDPSSPSQEDTASSDATGQESESEDYGSAYDHNSTVDVSEPEDVEVSDVTGEFSLTTKDGTISKEGNVYTLSSAGTYTASGNLEGQILVAAGEEDEVVLQLNEASIAYGEDSPIKAVSGGKLEISASKGTGNSVTDTRSHKTVEIEDQGEGAISADIDLKLKGAGTLVVTGNYNNGVHTTKDLKIQKQTLKVTGYNNAFKGKNSVTIESGSIQGYAQTGNGIKTEDSDVSSKGNQKGSIAINGGSVYLDSLHDAIDAAYNVEVSQADASVPTEITIKTGTKSTVYSKSSFTADSEKGLKAANEILIQGGTITVAASDDAVHANYGDALENGEKGLGNITVSDGLLQIASGDDGLHADNRLTVSGGKVIVTGAKEGFEANYIDITGGYSYIYGSDDGVNCSKKSFSTCAMTVSGGYLDVAVSSGDTDGIDSNGDFKMTGGIVVSRGSPGNGSGMSTGLDVDGTCSMSGGTLIAFNGLERSPSASSNVLYAGTQSNAGGGWGGRPGGGRPGGNSGSSYSFASGEYTLSGEGLSVSFVNDYAYSSFLVYSSNLSVGSEYALTKDGTKALSWTQSSNSVTIS